MRLTSRGQRVFDTWAASTTSEADSRLVAQVLHTVVSKTWHQRWYSHSILTGAGDGRYAIYPRTGLRIVVQLWVPEHEEEHETFDLVQIHEFSGES